MFMILKTDYFQLRLLLIKRVIRIKYAYSPTLRHKCFTLWNSIPGRIKGSPLHFYEAADI